MRRILLGLALVGLIGGFISTGDASAAQAKSRPTTTHVSRSTYKAHAARSNHKVRSTHTSRSTHVVRSNQKTQPTRTAHVSHKARSGRSARATHANRSLKKNRPTQAAKKVSWNGGPARRFFGTRLYYSNAFRGMIPGTGYGGFRRPAFGYRGY